MNIHHLQTNLCRPPWAIVASSPYHWAWSVCLQTRIAICQLQHLWVCIFPSFCSAIFPGSAVPFPTPSRVNSWLWCNRSWQVLAFTFSKNSWASAHRNSGKIKLILHLEIELWGSLLQLEYPISIETCKKPQNVTHTNHILEGITQSNQQARKEIHT